MKRDVIITERDWLAIKALLIMLDIAYKESDPARVPRINAAVVRSFGQVFGARDLPRSQGYVVLENEGVEE